MQVSGRIAIVVLAGSSLLCSCSSTTEPAGISRVVISPTSVNLGAIGDKIRLTATARDVSGSLIEGVSFSWNSSSGVAQVDSSGLVTALSNGRATISATAIGHGVSGDVEVTVLQLADSIAVSPLEATVLSTGGTQQFNAGAWDSNGNPILGAAFDWASADETVATLDETGLATIVGTGSTEVTASRDGAQGHSELRVLPELISVEVQPNADTLRALDDTVRFTAMVKDAGGNEIPGITFDWISSNQAVATVDSTGLVVALVNGTSTISAQVAGIEGSATAVVRQTADSVRLQPSTLPTFTSLHDTAQLSAEAWDANGHSIDDAEFDWESGNTLVATVSGSGLVTAVGNGSTTVSVTLDAISKDVEIQVDQVITAIYIDPELFNLVVQDTITLTASALDSNGYQVPVLSFDWNSSATNVATITQDGFVTAVGPGVSDISASADNVTGWAEVSVELSPGPTSGK